MNPDPTASVAHSHTELYYHLLIMLCETCRSIDFHFIEDWEDDGTYLANCVADDRNLALNSWREHRESCEDVFYFHHPNMRSLLQSAQAGCYFCAALWYAFTEPPVHWKVTEPLDIRKVETLPLILRMWWSEDWGSWRDCVANEPVLAFVGQCNVSMERTKCPIGILTYQITSQGLTSLGQFARPSYQLESLWASGDLLEKDSSTGSLVNLDLARRWLKTCGHSHTKCDVGSSLLPRRVIDIGPAGAPIIPILRETQEAETGRYIALSHSWGGEKPLRPISDKVESTWLLAPLSQWSRTFQQAVKVSRALGVQYIWIDAPCILQNDPDDWAIESTRMADYFRSSIITIAAGASTSGSGGCFRDRNPLLTRPLRLCTLSSQGPFELWISFSGPAANKSDETSHFDLPLYTRAWVLQEQLLPPRLLRFGTKSLYWTCTTGNASESAPSLAWAPKVTGKAAFRLHAQPIDWGPHDSDQRNRYYNVWYSEVASFSLRNLTYKKDVLPAISGLAIAVRTFLPPEDRYLAGLWEMDLMTGLLWHACAYGEHRLELPLEQPNFIDTDAAAPSWSWVSMSHVRVDHRLDMRITFGGYRHMPIPPEHFTRILNTEVVLKNPLIEYGEVLRGTLLVEAQLSSLIIAEPFERPVTQPGKWKFEYTIHATNARKATMPMVGFMEQKEGRESYFEGDCDLDQAESDLMSKHTSTKGIEAFFLPLLGHSNDYEQPQRVLGLALLPTGQDKEYVRIGRAGVDLSAHLYYNCAIPYQTIWII